MYPGIPGGRKRCYTLFPVTRKYRVTLDRSVVVCEVKRWTGVGVFPDKPSTCSCLLSARVENDAQEIPRYVTTEKM